MSDIKDLGDEKTVLDGTEYFPGQQTDGTTFHTPASALGVGPFTDGDGNVYSITFDSPGQTLSVECVTPDNTVSRVSALPGGVSGTLTAVDGRAADFTLDLDEVGFHIADVDGNDTSFVGFPDADQGVLFVARNSDASVVHRFRVSQLNGVEIDNVTVDPTLPWPGG